MSTERQRAANRANAKRSTGPKTVSGKSASSRNSRAHGLTAHPALSLPAGVEELAEAIAPGHRGDLAWQYAVIAAEATFELARVRSIRANMITAIASCETQRPLSSRQGEGKLEDQYEKVARLERYERRAFSRRKSAMLAVASLVVTQL